MAQSGPFLPSQNAWTSVNNAFKPSAYTSHMASRGVHATARHRKAHGNSEQDRPADPPMMPNIFAESPKSGSGIRHRTQYNRDPFTPTPSKEHYEYPLVETEWLSKQRTRPKKVRMLARDFIHDSLYNPHYGYFSRHAVLLPDNAQRGSAFDFSNCSKEHDFMVAIEERYRHFEESVRQNGDDKKLPSPQRSPVTPRARPGSREALEAAQHLGRLDLARQRQSLKEEGEHDQDVKAMVARQVWHTPTELFKPHYAHAIARYMVDNLPHGQALVIYEVGAGSGALAKDVLDFVRENHADLYAKMEYNIIEISPRLSEQQSRTLSEHLDKGKVQVTNKSIFDWQLAEERHCFFIALEVFDNLTHDIVRYATDTLRPYQAIVSIDDTGDMHELWEPVKDTRIKQYLSAKDKDTLPSSVPGYLTWLPAPLRRILTEHMPFYPNLTPPHYIPTGSLQLLDVLASQFPRHRLIMADFDSLPDAIPGLQAPVVQTRLNETMVAVTTYLVYQGFFDIFFPTNFPELQKVYASVMHKPVESEVLAHDEFLRRYADVTATTCRDGTNPMLSWYANAKWLLS